MDYGYLSFNMFVTSEQFPCQGPFYSATCAHTDRDTLQLYWWSEGSEMDLSKEESGSSFAEIS